MTSHLPMVSIGRVLGGLAVSRISFQPSSRSLIDSGGEATGTSLAAVLMGSDWDSLGSGNVRPECITLSARPRIGPTIAARPDVAQLDDDPGRPLCDGPSHGSIADPPFDGGPTMRPRQRPTTLAELALALATSMLLVVACGGGAGTGTDPDGAADGDQGGAVESQAAEAPGGGDLPDVADGAYTGGTAHIEVTGDKTLNADLALRSHHVHHGGRRDRPGRSTRAANRILIHTIVAFGTESGPAFSLTSPVVFAAGGLEQGCAFELTRNDASGLAGTFTCRGLDGMSAEGLEQPKVDVVGTFTADR